MKRFLFLLTCICAAFSTGNAQTPERASSSGIYTPTPTYPPDALKAKVTGSGMCQVTFDGSGHAVSALMTKSTGSKVLDQNTISVARTHWTGRPNVVASVPVEYRIVQTPHKAKPIIVTVKAVTPPYPEEARRNRLEGSCVVRISFDENGKLTGATLVKSTGLTILDQNTISAVTNTWHSSGGRAVTILVPIIYQMRR